MILKVSLTRYDKMAEFRFDIEIIACIVTEISVTHPDILHIDYSVGDPPHVENLPQVFLTPPGCGQMPVYTLYNAITKQPETWASLDLQNMVLVI